MILKCYGLYNFLVSEGKPLFDFVFKLCESFARTPNALSNGDLKCTSVLRLTWNHLLYFIGQNIEALCSKKQSNKS